MTREQLIDNINKKRSFLCIGLDPDIRKFPQKLLEEDDPVFTFNKKIIDSTQEFAIAYKLNVAYYENMGAFGMKAMDKTISYLRENYPNVFVIVDAKCAEINNAAEVFARNFFEHLKVDALTVMPYSGRDSLKPVLKYPDKWLLLVTLTPNESAEEFQLMKDEQGEYLFERVIRISKSWDNDSTLMYFVGSYKPNMYKRVRMIAPDAFLFVPSDDKIIENFDSIMSQALNREGCVIMGVSQRLIYSDDSEMFATKAAQVASEIRQMMFNALLKNGVISEE